MKLKAPTKKKPSSALSPIGKLMIATCLAYATQASAFLVDNSNQKTIMIGNAGESMQSVQVTPVSAPPPTSSIQITKSYPQQTAQPTYNNTTYSTSSANTTNYSYSTTSNGYPTTTYGNDQGVQYITGYDQVTPTQPTYQTQQTYPAQYQQPVVQYQQPTYPSNYGTVQTTQSPLQGYGNGAYERLALSLNSAAVLIFDPQTNQTLYEKNTNSQRAIASVSKMMTAMVVLDSGEDMRETLTISGTDLVGAKSASTRLKAGDQLTRSEFMLLMLMKSENPAAKTLASHYHGGYSAFISAMNQKAQSLGMYSTSFSDSSGLNPRNVSTASDLGKMMREIATNPRYQTIRNFSSAPSYDFYITNYNSGNRTYSASSTNRYVRSGSYDIKASKTGYIREAGYCVVMETNINNRPAIVVQLGAGSSDARWNDAGKILQQLAYRN